MSIFRRWLWPAFTVYLFSLSALLFAFGSLPLPPGASAGFLAAGTCTSLGAALCLAQARAAPGYCRRVLRPALFVGWAALSVASVGRSFFVYEGSSPWSELIMNSLACAVLGLALAPAVLVRLPARVEPGPLL